MFTFRLFYYPISIIRAMETYQFVTTLNSYKYRRPLNCLKNVSKKPTFAQYAKHVIQDQNWPTITSTDITSNES